MSKVNEASYRFRLICKEKTYQINNGSLSPFVRLLGEKNLKEFFVEKVFMQVGNLLSLKIFCNSFDPADQIENALSLYPEIYSVAFISRSVTDS